MDATLIRQLVWLDYRLALLFIALIPLGLLGWAFQSKSDPIKRSLLLYWRVASLVLITICLASGSIAVSFITGIVAEILIVLALWFWQDLNEDIAALRKSIKPIYLGWRWATTVYCTLGTIALLPFLGCAFSETAFKTPYCSVWLEAPLVFKDYFHYNSKPAFLGFLGIVTLIFYVVYLSYFVAVKLGKHGRSATH